MNDQLATTLRAYNAMVKFLNRYYFESKFISLGSMLGGMMFLYDGGTADPAIWGHWIKAAKGQEDMNSVDAYQAMLRFLAFELDYYTPSYVEKLYGEGRFTRRRDWKEYLDAKKTVEWLKKIRPLEDGTINKGVWERWQKCFEEALTEPEGAKEYLTFID